MRLLTDEALRDLIGDDRVIRHSPLQDDLQNDTIFYGRDSSVQASSVDLHIGEIYVPGRPGIFATFLARRTHNLGWLGKPKSQLSLKSGGTAVLFTQEELALTRDLAAFGVPPSSVSFRGLLMTNPGHVDPGYNGRLRFTVINMGREDFDLKNGDRIVTLLFFRLDANPHRDWTQRGNAASNAPDENTMSTINGLSADFLEVNRRAEAIARQTLGWAGVLTAAISVAISGAFTWYNNVSWRDPVSHLQQDLTRLQATADLKPDIAKLQATQDLTTVQASVKRIQKELAASRAQVQSLQTSVTSLRRRQGSGR